MSANKEIIANAAKCAAAIGGLTAVANQVAQANEELKQIEAIETMRETAEMANYSNPTPKNL